MSWLWTEKISQDNSTWITNSCTSVSSLPSAGIASCIRSIYRNIAWKNIHWSRSCGTLMKWYAVKSLLNPLKFSPLSSKWTVETRFHLVAWFDLYLMICWATKATSTANTTKPIKMIMAHCWSVSCLGSTSLDSCLTSISCALTGSWPCVVKDTTGLKAPTTSDPSSQILIAHTRRW